MEFFVAIFGIQPHKAGTLVHADGVGAHHDVPKSGIEAGGIEGGHAPLGSPEDADGDDLLDGLACRYIVGAAAHHEVKGLVVVVVVIGFRESRGDRGGFAGGFNLKRADGRVATGKKREQQHATQKGDNFHGR